MKLVPEYKLGDKPVSDGLEIQQILTDKFNSVGKAAGVYSVQVSTVRDDGVTIFSNQVKVEVFDTVRLDPGDLLIYPGGRWTIQVKGGPIGSTRSKINTTYKMADEEIATIDQDGEVLGKKVGDTYITIKMDYDAGQQRYELASETAKVRVRLISAIQIPVMSN